MHPQETKLFKEYTLQEVLDEFDVIECFAVPGQRLLVAGKDNLDKMLNRLKSGGVDIGVARNQGQLHLSKGADTPRAMAALISQSMGAAKGRFRLFGDMTWVKEKQWRLEAIRQLEDMGNNFLNTPGRLYLCQYPLASFSGEELMMVAETHKYTLYKSALRESPYFSPH